MSTETKHLQQVEALQDDSCHWYVIPTTMRPKWDRLNEIMDGDNQLDFEEAEAKFIETFDQYRTGGDLNNIQLYASI